LENIQKTKDKTSWFNNKLCTYSKLFYLHTILSSIIFLSLVFALPHWYSFLKKKKTPTIFYIPTQQSKLYALPWNHWFTCFVQLVSEINITILPTIYVYMAWLLQYNLALNNEVNVFHGVRIVLTPKLKEENITPSIMIGVPCMNHYTNFKVQTIFKIFARILSMCYNVCMHTTTITLEPMSKVSSCI
jgi:hypothetical protein